MPSFIGNNIAFNGRGVVGADLILPDEYDYLGNGSSLFAKILRLYVGTHARASDNYMLAKNPSSGLYEMTGPFTSNVLATRNIGGEIGGLFEGLFATETTYSEAFRAAISNWTNSKCTVTDNAINSPLGDLTADFIYENTDNNNHEFSITHASDGSSRYYGYCFLKQKERYKIQLAFRNLCFVGDPYVRFDLSAGTAYLTNDVDDYGILPMPDDWYLCYFAATSDTADTNIFNFRIADSAGNLSYLGDGSSGLYAWGANVIKADHWTNYIKAESSPAIKPADYFYWDSSLIPNWFKDEFTVKMIPNYDYPSQISVDKPIWSFHKTAQTIASGYGYNGMVANDTYVYWARSSGIIYRLPIDGGETPTELITGLTNPVDVTIDSTYIYWTDTGTGKVQRALLDGSSVTDLATGQTDPYGICVDASYVYWTDNTDDKIQKVAIGGGAASDVVTSETNLRGIATDNTYLYYSQASSVRRVAIAGGSSENVVSLDSVPLYIDLDDNFIYCGDGSSDVIVAVNRNTKVKSNVVELSSADPYGIAVYAGTIFYGRSPGSAVIRVDHVTAWLATDGKIKVIDGPDTKVETDALSCDMHNEVTIEFNRGDGEIKTEGFTGDDTFTGSSWTSPNGYDVQYGGALKGAASSDGILFEPRG